MMNLRKSSLAVALASVLCCSLFFCSTALASAPDTERKDSDYTVTYSAEPLTDIDDLIALAASQSQHDDINPLSRLALGNTDDTIIAEQLIETRKYQDGTVENEYIVTGIAAYEEDGLARITPRTSETRLDDAYGSGYGVATAVQLSYVSVFEPSSTGNPAYHFNFKFIRGKVVDKNAGINVNIQLAYKHTDQNWEDHRYYSPSYSNVTTGSWYTWNSARTFYVHNMIGGANGTGTFTVSGSSSGEIETTVVAQRL